LLLWAEVLVTVLLEMGRLAQIPRVNQIVEKRTKSLPVKKEKRNAERRMPVNLDPVRRKILLPVKREEKLAPSKNKNAQKRRKRSKLISFSLLADT